MTKISLKNDYENTSKELEAIENEEEYMENAKDI